MFDKYKRGWKMIEKLKEMGDLVRCSIAFSVFPSNQIFWVMDEKKFPSKKRKDGEYDEHLTKSLI